MIRENSRGLFERLISNMNTDQQKVIQYFSRIGTRLGFDYVLWGSKHFGYYPNGKKDIREREAQVLLQDLVAKNLALKENQVVLDAGCGQGVVSTYLAKKYGPNISGITLVPFEVTRARTLAKKLGVQDKTNYQVMDYSATTFADNYFDAIYTTETLSHSPNIRKTLKEFYRILKPGGSIALFEYTIAPDEQFSLHEIKMFNRIIEGSAMLGLKDFRHDMFPGVLRDAGFAQVSEQNITKHIWPSFYRLYRLSRWPYRLVKIFGLQKFFINVTAAHDCPVLFNKDLFRYCIFTGHKPRT